MQGLGWFWPYDVNQYAESEVYLWIIVALSFSLVTYLSIFLLHWLGINVMEEKSYSDSFWISWCWALTHVCWQCSNAACSLPKTGLFWKEKDIIFHFTCEAQEKLYSPIVYTARAYNTWKWNGAVRHNCDQQHIRWYFVRWGVNDHWKHWDASIC